MTRTRGLAAAVAFVASATACSTPITGTPHAAAAAAPAAQASGLVDRVYLSTIRRQGIGTNDDERELRRAQAVCSLFNDGSSYQQVRTALMANGFTFYDSGFLTGAAVAAYCPQHTRKVLGG